MFKMKNVMISFALIAMLGVAVMGCPKEPIVEPSGNDTVVEPELVSLSGTVWEGPAFMEMNGMTVTVDNELDFITDSTGYYTMWYTIMGYTPDPVVSDIRYDFDGVSNGWMDIYNENGELYSRYPLTYKADEDVLIMVMISSDPELGPDLNCELHRKVE